MLLIMAKDYLLNYIQLFERFDYIIVLIPYEKRAKRKYDIFSEFTQGYKVLL